MRSPARPLGGLVAATTVAALGRCRRSLSRSGAVAAVPVGTAIVAAGGWWWGALIVAFFGSSSWLSRQHPHPAGQTTQPRRGSERDVVQVLANGAIAALIAASSPYRSPPARRYRYPAYAGALAAATADTWATEIGAGSRSAPRLITTGRVVPPGTSGGVTRRGTAGAFAGASFLGMLAAVVPVEGPHERRARIIGATALAGVAGAMTDSLLGATLQAAYQCPVCGATVEHPRHCDTGAVLVRGVPAVTNDLVNLAATGTGAVAATGISWAVDRYC